MKKRAEVCFCTKEGPIPPQWVNSVATQLERDCHTSSYPVMGEKGLARLLSTSSVIYRQGQEGQEGHLQCAHTVYSRKTVHRALSCRWPIQTMQWTVVFSEWCWGRDEILSILCTCWEPLTSGRICRMARSWNRRSGAGHCKHAQDPFTSDWTFRIFLTLLDYVVIVCLVPAKEQESSLARNPIKI